MTKLSVSELSIYPVKSCREVKLNTAFIGSFGLNHDRRWMVVDKKGVMLTQRQISKMCLIQVELTDLGVVLTVDSMDSLFIATPSSRKKVSVKVWLDDCQAYDAGEKAAKWLSIVLSIECRLVYFPDGEFRQIDLSYANKGEGTAFSDGFPILLISDASLSDLNSRLTHPITMQHFRSNIVVSGCSPFEEDNWKKIQIGNIIFRIVKPCSRCIIPNINIETAIREREPIKTLASYRKRNGKVFFGQNVIADSLGDIDVGMSIEVIE